MDTRTNSMTDSDLHGKNSLTDASSVAAETDNTKPANGLQENQTSFSNQFDEYH